MPPLRDPPSSGRGGLRLYYRKTSDGTWYLEWRDGPFGALAARRKARDTEIELIERIRALEVRVANPSAPRPVADLKLKPYDPSRYRYVYSKKP